MDGKKSNGLAELHALHLQLREVQEQLERGPKQLKARQQFTQQKQADLEAQKQKQKTLKVTADQKSLQLKSNEAKITDLRVKLNQASSNREFDIIKTQIEADTVSNSVLEDEILDTLEKVDAVQVAIRKLEDEVSAARAEEGRISNETNAARAGLEARIVDLQAKLSQAETCVPGDFLLSYRRLVQAYGAGALAEVEGNTCSSCFVSIPPQMTVQVRAGQIVVCKTCGRLLYLRAGK